MARGSKKQEVAMVGIPQGPAVEEYCVKPDFDADGVQVRSGIGLDGKEYPDPVPMSPPIGYQPPSDLTVMLEQLFNRGRAVLEAAEIETEEEANDFDIPDDPLDPLTEYEKVFLPADKPAVPPAPPAAPAVAAAPAVPASAEVITAAAEGGPQKSGAVPTPLKGS